MEHLAERLAVILRPVDELGQTGGDDGADRRIVTVGAYVAPEHLVDRQVSRTDRNGPGEGARRREAAVGKLALRAGHHLAIPGRDGGAMTLDDDAAPVCEGDAVDTAAARVEEVVVVDAGAEPRSALCVDASGDGLRISAAEQLALEWKIVEPPRCELPGDDCTQCHRYGTSRRMQTRSSGSSP
jgi:hypothetical protein